MSELIKKIHRVFRYADLEKEEYDLIIPYIEKENRRNLKTYSLVAFSFLFIMYCLSFGVKDIANNRWVYGSFMFVSAICYCLAEKSTKNSKLILPAVYIFMGILFAFDLVLGILASIDEQTVTFVALLLTVPLLFIDRPYRMVNFVVTFIIIFIIMASIYKTGYVLAIDIIDVIMFGSLGLIVSTYMIQVKCQRFMYERQVTMLSETDLLTGLYNRNSYENKVKKYESQKLEKLGCIYIDVNGLHEMNNNYGHEAGDTMLKYVANSMKEVFGEYHNFRIGGDEFVIFTKDVEENELNEKVIKLQEIVETQDYHISVGYHVSDTDKEAINMIVKKAEKRMYEAKDRFYAENGQKTRGR
ncbi:MAG: GGDEF domain-containing protein [Erysipelotrichaceae bacterium]|nr:GGDEF domain-containing protein [Erysipelotrichaceae bacterium]